MSRIGDAIDSFDELYAEWFEDELLVTNYVEIETEQSHDSWDDPSEKQETPDSPIAITGQIDPISAVADSQPWARDIDADVVIYVDEDAPVSDGEQAGMPYQSDVRPADYERYYRITHITDEGNGVLRCLATSMPYRGDQQ